MSWFPDIRSVFSSAFRCSHHGPRDYGSHDNSRQHIRWKMYKEIQPGKRGKHRQHQGRNPPFPVKRKMQTAPSKLTRECPDGKEKSFGTATSSSTEGSSQQGRCLAAIFLSITLPRRNPAAMDISIHPPNILVLGNEKSRTPIRIQNHPWSPREVMNTISPSTKGVRSSCSVYKSGIR